MSQSLNQRAATPDDLPWIMGVESDPAFSPYIVSWEQERHRAALADPRFHYRIAFTPQEPRAGFAILIQDHPTPGQLYLQRLAILLPGQGLGQRFLHLLCQESFSSWQQGRLWLHVFPENHRAQTFYKAFGFCLDPGGPEMLHHHGRGHAALVMSLEASAWKERGGELLSMNDNQKH